MLTHWVFVFELEPFERVFALVLLIGRSYAFARVRYKVVNLRSYFLLPFLNAFVQIFENESKSFLSSIKFSPYFFVDSYFPEKLVHIIINFRVFADEMENSDYLLIVVVLLRACLDVWLREVEQELIDVCAFVPL